jgi:hypothetical protein
MSCHIPFGSVDHNNKLGASLGAMVRVGKLAPGANTSS